MNWNIEFYRENDLYCAYIGSDGSSGISIKAKSKNELAQDIASYVLDLNNELDNWE